MKKATDMHGHEIDDLFAKARAQAPLDSEALIEKVLADAMMLQPKPMQRHIRPRQNPGFWASTLYALGGKAGLAGVGSAAVVGVILGFVQPTSLTTLTDAFIAQAPLGDLDLIPGVDAILTEG